MKIREHALTNARRSILIANYREEKPVRAPLRAKFPAEGDFMGGISDGYKYETIFTGASLKDSYGMIKNFLREEGYGDLPIPQTIDELILFRLPVRNKQILLFEDNGYVHNPIKILFPNDRRKKKTLILQLFNESDPEHLLKFHRIYERYPRK